MDGVDVAVGSAAPARTAVGGNNGVIVVVVVAGTEVDAEAAQKIGNEREDAAAAVDGGQVLLGKRGAMGGQMQTRMIHTMIPPQMAGRIGKKRHHFLLYYNGIQTLPSRGERRFEDEKNSHLKDKMCSSFNRRLFTPNI